MKTLKHLVALFAAPALMAGWSTNACAGKEIEGSYIVTFHSATAGSRSPILPALKERELKEKERLGIIPKFGEHSSGQSKAALARELGINGRVDAIFDQINAAHLLIDAAEADRLRRDRRVSSVRQARWFEPLTAQPSPGWALDRLDQPFLADNSIPPKWSVSLLNNQYTYGDNGTGAEQVIWVLDSGLDLSNNIIKSEFCVRNALGNCTTASRASIFHDFNGGNGFDCSGHGTQVASVAASHTYGVAKGVEVRIVKITGVPGYECIAGGNEVRWLQSFNWLATNGTKGHIVNFSYGPYRPYGQCPNPNDPEDWPELDAAIQAAHNRGVIVVVSAGNDGCNTADFSPQRSPAAFVVGATDYSRLRTPANPNAPGKDARWFEVRNGYTFSSRIGTNIAAWAPGYRVSTLNWDGFPIEESGTSLAAPYIAGLFAAGCASASPFCCNMATASDAFQLLKSQGRDTAVNFDGNPLPAGTTARTISRNGW